jgi:hypothetical protein
MSTYTQTHPYTHTVARRFYHKDHHYHYYYYHHQDHFMSMHIRGGAAHRRGNGKLYIIYIYIYIIYIYYIREREREKEREIGRERAHDFF